MRNSRSNPLVSPHGSFPPFFSSHAYRLTSNGNSHLTSPHVCGVHRRRTTRLISNWTFRPPSRNTILPHSRLPIVSPVSQIFSHLTSRALNRHLVLVPFYRTINQIFSSHCSEEHNFVSFSYRPVVHPTVLFLSHSFPSETPRGVDGAN